MKLLIDYIDLIVTLQFSFLILLRKKEKLGILFDKLNIYNSSHKLHIILCTEVIKLINIILITKQTPIKTKKKKKKQW